MKRSAESTIVGIGGAILSGAVGSIFGLGLPAAIVGGLNGAISGWRRIYRWTSPIGWLAAILDSTWAIFTTTAAVFAHMVAIARRDGSFSTELSERHNRHVYGEGLRVRRGFAITYGNTICGAGPASRRNRARLVTDHENVHVWQARWFGPLFPLLYGAWMVLGGLVGGGIWIFGIRKDRFTKTVESCAYYLNPFEWWAYSRDESWPPSGKVSGLGPKRPMVRSFASKRVGD